MINCLSIRQCWQHAKPAIIITQLSSRYGAALPTRRYPACRCNLSPSPAVDIFVRPGSSGYETNCKAPS